jgi:6-phosphogluconate dehydrogenase (decarboxylating)
MVPSGKITDETITALAAKMLAARRNQFGGHAVKKAE